MKRRLGQAGLLGLLQQYLGIGGHSGGGGGSRRGTSKGQFPGAVLHFWWYQPGCSPSAGLWGGCSGHRYNKPATAGRAASPGA